MWSLLVALGILSGARTVESKAPQPKTQVLSPGSEALQSWLDPPVETSLKFYLFHVTNPLAVTNGHKPVLEEVGPFVYKTIIKKDNIDQNTGKSSLKFNDDSSTLTYRPRKFYFLDRDGSVGDPDNTFITMPNIPLLGSFKKVRDMSWSKHTAVNMITQTGLGTLFINVSVSGLLWGYHDELPCLNLVKPHMCPDEIDDFSDDSSEWGDDDDWKRKKRETTQVEDTKNPEFVDCKCQWGLFRGINGTLREAVKMHHGMKDLNSKGWVEEYDNNSTFNWWKEGSKCDKVGGLDGSSFPPGLKKVEAMDIFISGMRRRLKFEYEKDIKYRGLNAYRFIPPLNALGSHADIDPNKRNTANACYCLEEDSFSCFKSGVYIKPLNNYVAFSFPHFYQADQSYLEYADGLKPNKEKHQAYIDLHPETGTPLAFLKRFQFNAIIERDSDIPIMRNVANKIILPFLWVADGYGGPSDEMMAAVKGDSEDTEDFKIDHSFFPKIPNMMTHLMEFKVRLLLKEKVVITPGETKVVSTTSIIDGKLEGFGMEILAHENTLFKIESEKHFPPEFRGRIIVQVTNYSKIDLSLPASSALGYLLIHNLVM